VRMRRGAKIFSIARAHYVPAQQYGAAVLVDLRDIHGEVRIRRIDRDPGGEPKEAANLSVPVEWHAPTSNAGGRHVAQSRRLIIDANILVRSVLGVRTRELIERYCESNAFYVAESHFEEAAYYLAELTVERGIREEVCRESLCRLMAAVQIIQQEKLTSAESDAKARIGARDIDDWPAVAGAIQFDCPVWTEDQDFFGSEVPTWTAASVEIFLRGA